MYRYVRLHGHCSHTARKASPERAPDYWTNIMGQSLSRNLVHLVYSTRDRRGYLYENIREGLFAYQAGIYRSLDSPAIVIGGVDDHVHSLFVLSKNQTLAHVVEQVKKNSSKWMKSDGGVSTFSWQGGYASFSASESSRELVTEYIRRQFEHHRKMSYQDELIALLKKHNVAFDEAYLWR